MEVPLKPKHGLFVGVAVVVVAVVAYLVFGGGDAPAELTLGERAVVEDGVEEATGPSTTVAPVEFTNIMGCNVPPRVKEAAYNIADVGISRYSVVEGSIAGYRVVEDFIGGMANVDAVGRTTAIQGDLFTHTGFIWALPAPDEDLPPTTTVPPDSSLASYWFCVDVASITSDKGSRDNRFRTAIMDTANFPVATFVAVPPPFSSFHDSDIPETGPTTLTIPTPQIERSAANIDADPLAAKKCRSCGRGAWPRHQGSSMTPAWRSGEGALPFMSLGHGELHFAGQISRRPEPDPAARS